MGALSSSFHWAYVAPKRGDRILHPDAMRFEHTGHLPLASRMTDIVRDQELGHRCHPRVGRAATTPNSTNVINIMRTAM